MSEEEINRLLNKIFFDYVSPNLVSIDNKIEKLHEDIKKEREELLMRALHAEAKLNMYEGFFTKLNLNVEVKNDNRPQPS